MTQRDLLLVALVATAIASSAAQQPSFRTETRLVVLHATVRNRRGVEVTDLEQRAFTVYENGRPQPITLFRRDDIPVSIALVIDNSGSMRALRTRVERAAIAFVAASNPLDEVCVVNFADKPRLDVPLTTEMRRVEEHISRFDSIGGTALRDAVDMAESYLRDHATRDRRVLLVITDGRDNASQVTVPQIEALSRRNSAAVYAIGLFRATGSSEAKDGRHELEALTRRTGGMAYYPASAGEIDAVAVQLAQQIRRQYTIAYAPANQALDGSYRRIRLKAHDREPLVVETRVGYVATPNSQ